MRVKSGDAETFSLLYISFRPLPVAMFIYRGDEAHGVQQKLDCSTDAVNTGQTSPPRILAHLQLPRIASISHPSPALIRSIVNTHDI